MTFKALEAVKIPFIVLSLFLVLGCQPIPTAKVKPKPDPVQAVTPKWRYAFTADDAAIFASTEVQTVGTFKRLWLSDAYAKPTKVTLQGSTGLATGRDDLIELD